MVGHRWKYDISGARDEYQLYVLYSLGVECHESAAEKQWSYCRRFVSRRWVLSNCQNVLWYFCQVRSYYSCLCPIVCHSLLVSFILCHLELCSNTVCPWHYGNFIMLWMTTVTDLTVVSRDFPPKHFIFAHMQHQPVTIVAYWCELVWQQLSLKDHNHCQSKAI